jgi:hypothetical protein
MEILNFYREGCKIPANAIYIGRHSAKNGLPGSKYANPFPAKNEEERPRVVQKYQNWLAQEINQGRITREELAELHGKDLVCYCAPKLCHGHVLRAAILWAVKELAQPPEPRNNLTRPSP